MAGSGPPPHDVINIAGPPSLEGGLVNPLQALALILGNACASHQEPAGSKLCLSITAIRLPCFVPLTLVNL